MNDFSGQSFGRYHLIERLGEGGMATVYKAYDTHLECEVAVKIIRTDQLAPAILERALKRFEREAKAVAQMTHPNIVKVSDYGEEDGLPYLVMPYLAGGTLKKYLGKLLPYTDAARILLPIAKALQYAHDHKIIHRDVKPSNILITESGEPMLTDFGIAKILDLQDAQTLTGTGVGIGTPEYMAPEQGLGREVDGRADIYSLGVVFYELVTGRKPYTADTPMAVVLKQSTEPLPRPSSLVSGLPEKVEQVLYKALAKNPEDRYQSIEELERAFSELCLVNTLQMSEAIKPSDEVDVDTSENETSLDVTEVKNEPVSEKVFPPPPGITAFTEPPPISNESPKKPAWLWIVLIGVIAICFIVFLVRSLSNSHTYAAATEAPTVEDFSSSTDGNFLAAQRNWAGSQLHAYSSDIEDPAPTPGYSTFEYESIYVSQPGIEDYRVSELGGCGSPVWSPDGKWIAFVRTSLDWSSSSIVIVDSVGNLRKEINGNFLIDRIEGLSWSSDGNSLIAYDWQNARVVMIDVETETITTLVNSSAEQVSLSPNGNNIAYLTRESETNDDDGWLLNILNLETYSITTITTVDDRFGLYGPFYWTADGEYVTFQGWNIDDQGERINYANYQVRPDGSEMQVLYGPVEILDQSYYPWFRTING